MNSKSSLALSPNGNGGWFKSMANAELTKNLLDDNIEWINVFSVDNVLQRIADPVFLGATIVNNNECGSKVVSKINPNEKVGVICQNNNKPFIIEYYEISQDMINKKNNKGNYVYGYGVTLNYLFRVDKLIKILDKEMPLHISKKSITYLNNDGDIIQSSSPNALTFETLALDMIYEMDNCLSFEVDRNKEFAPVKNKEGFDSIKTAQDLLTKNGYEL